MSGRAWPLLLEVTVNGIWSYEPSVVMRDGRATVMGDRVGGRPSVAQRVSEQGA